MLLRVKSSTAPKRQCLYTTEPAYDVSMWLNEFVRASEWSSQKRACWFRSLARSFSVTSQEDLSCCCCRTILTLHKVAFQQIIVVLNDLLQAALCPRREDSDMRSSFARRYYPKCFWNGYGAVRVLSGYILFVSSLMHILRIERCVATTASCGKQQLKILFWRSRSQQTTTTEWIGGSQMRHCSLGRDNSVF